MTNLRNQYQSSGLSELLNDILNSEAHENGYSGTFFAVVINNNDPRKLGRCRCRAFNIFDTTIPDNDIPWALPDFKFIGSRSGDFVVPMVGTIVNIEFDNGDLYCPRYSSSGLEENTLPSIRTLNYPDNMVMYTTDDGEYLSVNRKTKETTFRHSSGTTVVINKDGKVSITSVDTIEIGNGDNKLVIDKDDCTLHSKGPVRLDSDDKVIIGPNNGYIVTSPTPGPIVDVAQLTAQTNSLA